MALAPLGRHPECRAGIDHRGLERPDQRSDQQTTSSEGDDRISHELPRTVIGHLAPALDPNQLDAARRELYSGCPNVGFVGLAAERENGWMLNQQEPVSD